MSESSASSAAAVIGFKEWAFICDALIQGRQALILRKGGIHEGRGGFEFKHREFFLFPTWFHTQGEKLRWVPEAAKQAGYSSDPGYDAATQTFAPEEQRQVVDVDGFCTLDGVWRVTDWDKVQALEPHHIWNEDVVKDRFAYDEESCLNIALVRAYKLPQRWTFPYQKSYGGCRSWIQLPTPPVDPHGLTPVLDDATFASLKGTVGSILA